MNNLPEIVKSFAGKKVLVVGDVMLDSYIVGDSTRLSPEAPVPIVHMKEETFVPGGAANLANNIVTLGGIAYLVGVVGNDMEKNILCAELEKRFMPSSFLVTDESRPTIKKTRVVSGGNQIARIDSEKTHKINADIENAVIKHIEILIRDAHAIVISDYGKGVITEKIAETIKINARGKPVIIDPKPQNAPLYACCYLITPNISEARDITGISCTTDELAEQAARKIASALHCSVVVKRGSGGITVFDKNSKETLHIKALAKEVFDVSGAGDTVVSALALAAAAGTPLLQAAEIANIAAGIKVGKSGTAPVHAHELQQELGIMTASQGSNTLTSAQRELFGNKHFESPKVWGKEVWVVNNEKYCGKIMHLKEGFRCSLHHHNKKHETFYVLSGRMFIELGDEKLVLGPGESVQVPTGTKHRFTGLGDTKFIEFSTHHEEEDSLRHVPSDKMPEEEFEQLKQRY